MAKVKVYSTPTCPYCIKVKSYLKEKNVDFESIDVASNEAGLAEMVRVSGQMGVPVVLIDAEVIIGFDKDKINSKLGI